MRHEFLVGIFTGNHAGAELRFEAGEYNIGSAAECDVVLVDSTIAPRHCSLTLAPDGTVGLIPLEGKLVMKGEEVFGPLNWPPRTTALAGLVCLAWTYPEQGWTGLKIPALLETEKSPAEADAERRGSQAKTEGAAQVAPGSACKDKKKPASKKCSYFRRLAVAGMIILLVGALSISLSTPMKKIENRQEMLEQALQEEGFTDLRVEDNAGRIMIYGLVPTRVDANRLRDLAAGLSFPVQVVVRNREEFSGAVLTALAGHGLFPRVRFEGGEALLQGYAQDSLTENAALSWARSAAPPVAPIRSVLLTRDVVEETLMAELSKAGLGEKTVVEWRPGVVAIRGETADKEALAEVMEAVRSALSSPIAFQLNIASEPEIIYVSEAEGKSGLEDVPGLDFAPGQDSPFDEKFFLRSVTPLQAGSAGLPFITTSDGAVYFLGGILPGGYVLTGIHADWLEFSRKGSNMAYKLQRR